MEIIQQKKHWQKKAHMQISGRSRPSKYDDYEEEEDEYVDSDSEVDELPTHEIKPVEDDIMVISTRKKDKSQLKYMELVYLLSCWWWNDSRQEIIYNRF